MTQSLFRVLNLGLGRQSTAVYLMSREGSLPSFDACVFADVGEEPAHVYRHLEWLLSLGGPPIYVRSAGKLGDDLIRGTNVAGGTSKGGRFASIPAFTATDHNSRGGQPASACEVGRVQRQCTRDYKIDVVEKFIRRELLELAHYGRWPKGVVVEQWFGIAYDERRRAERIRKRFEDGRKSVPVFPLVEKQLFTDECVAYVNARTPHPIGRSACVFCPYKSSGEWLLMKETDPAGWARAVEIDRAIRDPSARAGQGLSQSLYLHRQCIPLEMVDLQAEADAEASRRQPDLFSLYCCDGMCGV